MRWGQGAGGAATVRGRALGRGKGEAAAVPRASRRPGRGAGRPGGGGAAAGAACSLLPTQGSGPQRRRGRQGGDPPEPAPLPGASSLREGPGDAAGSGGPLRHLGPSPPERGAARGSGAGVGECGPAAPPPSLHSSHGWTRVPPLLTGRHPPRRHSGRRGPGRGAMAVRRGTGGARPGPGRPPPAPGRAPAGGMPAGQEKGAPGSIHGCPPLRRAAGGRPVGPGGARGGARGPGVGAQGARTHPPGDEEGWWWSWVLAPSLNTSLYALALNYSNNRLPSGNL